MAKKKAVEATQQEHVEVCGRVILCMCTLGYVEQLTCSSHPRLPAATPQVGKTKTKKKKVKETPGKTVGMCYTVCCTLL